MRLANDADVRALGEMHFGAARDFRHIAVVKVSGGIGCGLIHDGQLLAGPCGAAGEIGHWTVNTSQLDAVSDRLLPKLDSRVTCDCQAHGHLQSYASVVAITRRMVRQMPAVARLRERAAGRAGGYETLFGEIVEHWHAAQVLLADKKSLSDVQQAVDHAVDQALQLLGQAIVNLVLVFNPEVIILTGRLAELGPGVLDPLRDATRNMKPRSGALPELRLGSGGEGDQPWIGVRGAARAAIEEFIDPNSPPGR